VVLDWRGNDPGLADDLQSNAIQWIKEDLSKLIPAESRVAPDPFFGQMM
jgi:hypothetical protein